MRLYPAIRAQMGDWTYYIVRMKMREIAHEVQFAHDIYTDTTLSDAVQRTLNETRVKKEIVGYLARRPDRFFSSIVVAALEGEPTWTPVEMDESIVPRVFSQSRQLSDSFGVLSFGEEPKYYALDGQHRVNAIKLIVNGEANQDPPEGFYDDMLSVIVVLREEHDVPEGEWLRRYRRLFSSLNRYAKATDRDTNIIMDEDDLFAILTRRLITDHRFFQAIGRQKDSHKVKTKGKNIRSADPHFTSLQTLYAMNEKLLSSRARQSEPVQKQFRPSEDLIDERYNELANYWDSLLLALPELEAKPSDMRHHTMKGKDCLLFWPIGQELFIEVVRLFLDDAFVEGYASVEEMSRALSVFSNISWQLHEPPWRNLILVRESPEGPWRMRNEERKEAIKVAKRILQWILNLDPLSIDDVKKLRTEWINMLYSVDQAVPTNATEIDAMWKQIQEISESTL